MVIIGYYMDGPSKCAHYANDALTFLLQQGICFVPKDANPPGVAWLKKVFYDGGWEATSIPGQRKRIKEKARQITLLTILFNTVKERLAVCT